MPRQDSGTLYTYSQVEKIMVYAGVLFFTVVTLIVTALSVLGFLEFLQDIPSDMLANLRMVAAYLLLPAMTSLFLFYFSNISPSLRITDKGIYVQVFLFWWAFVPWQDVEEIRRLRLSRSRLVIVRRLTPIHRLISSGSTWKFKPAFLIKHTLIGFDKAVKTIEKNAGRSF